MNLGLIPARSADAPDRFKLDIKEARHWAGKAQQVRSGFYKMQKALLKNREEIQKLPNPFHVLTK